MASAQSWLPRAYKPLNKNIYADAREESNDKAQTLLAQMVTQHSGHCLEAGSEKKIICIKKTVHAKPAFYFGQGSKPMNECRWVNVHLVGFSAGLMEFHAGRVLCFGPSSL